MNGNVNKFFLVCATYSSLKSRALIFTRVLENFRKNFNYLPDC